MLPNKISGNKITKASQSSTGEFESFIDHKEMGNISRTGMNNWRRYYTKKTRRYIKSDTEKEIEYSND